MPSVDGPCAAQTLLGPPVCLFGAVFQLLERLLERLLLGLLERELAAWEGLEML